MEGVNEAGNGAEDLLSRDSSSVPKMKLKLVLQLADEMLRFGVLEQGEGDARQTISKDSVEEDLSILRVRLADLLDLRHQGKVSDQNMLHNLTCFPFQNLLCVAFRGPVLIAHKRCFP